MDTLPTKTWTKTGTKEMKYSKIYMANDPTDTPRQEKTVLSPTMYCFIRLFYKAGPSVKT